MQARTFRNWFTNQRRPLQARRAPRTQPWLERMEDRVTPSISGPEYPALGGNAFGFGGTSLDQPGGVTFSFSSMNAAFTKYWAPTINYWSGSSIPDVAVNLTQQTVTATDGMFGHFDVANSNLANGVAVWTRTGVPVGTLVPSTADVHLVVTISDGGGFLPWISPPTGLNGSLEEVLQVQGNFSANMQFEVGSGAIGTWQAVSTFFASLPPGGNGYYATSFGSAFWRETDDFGDAPASYGDASHTVSLPSTPRLGALVDTEHGSQYSNAANGDNTANLNDEDGVTFANFPLTGGYPTFAPGGTGRVDVATPTGGFLNAWIDFNGNGAFDGGEQVANNLSLGVGSTPLTFSIPSSATDNIATGGSYMRFRITSTAVGAPSPIGGAADGEVEDYRVQFVSPTTVYVAPSFTGTAGDLASGHVLGYDAFNTITTGLAVAASTGQVIVSSGTYAEAASVTGTRTLTIDTGAAVTINSLATIAGTTVQINGTSLTVGDGTNTAVAGVITGAGALTKTGSGTLTLSHANTYAGTTTVSVGALNIQNGSALGVGGAGSGTTVLSGAALEIQGGITVSNEPLTLNGNGISGQGALRNIATNNGWYGGITLASNATIGGTSGAGNELVIGTNGIGESGGSRTLDVVGPISFVMQAANTYTGTTTVTGSGAGSLRLRGSGTTINGDLVIGDGTVAKGVFLDNSNQIADTSHVTVNANSVFGLGPFGGVTETIDRLTGLGEVKAASSGSNTLTVGGNNGSSTFDGKLTDGTGGGTLALDKVGSGTLTLYPFNTYTGGTTVSDGTLKFDLTTAWQPQLGAISVATPGTLELYNTNLNVDNVLITGNTAITGTGKVAKTGSGYVSFWNDTDTIKDFAGLVDIQQGALGSNGNGWQNSAGLMDLNVASGASFDIRVADVKVNQLTGSGKIGSSHNQAVTLFAGSNGGTSTFSGVIRDGGDSSMWTGGPLNAGTISFTKTGTGTQTLSGANSYSGDTTISAGVLQLGAAGVIPDGVGKGNVVMNPSSGTATLDLGGFSETINGLTGNASSIVDNSAVGGPFTLTVGNNNATSTFSGVLQNTAGTLALGKIGSGTLTLTNANTYTGTTSVTDGKLLVNGSTTSATTASGAGTVAGSGSITGGVTVNSGGTLAGTVTINGNVAVNSGGTVTPADDSTVGTLTVNGAMNFALGATVKFNIVADGGNNLSVPVAGTDYDQIVVTGALVAGNTTLDLLSTITPANFTKNFDLFTGTSGTTAPFNNTSPATPIPDSTGFIQDSIGWYIRYNNAGKVTVNGTYNNPPTAIAPAGPFSTPEDSVVWLPISGFSATDIETTSPAAFQYKITSLPSGHLSTSNASYVPVTVGQIFSGPPTLYYLPYGCSSEAGIVDSFTFVVIDTAVNGALPQTSAPANVSITITAPLSATFGTRVVNPVGSVLEIRGTPNNDVITVSQLAANTITVTSPIQTSPGVYAQTTATYSGVLSLKIWGFAGIDNINLNTVPAVSLPTYFLGGAGNDNLFGGSGADEIYGNSGNDYLTGNNGADYLSGCGGDDTVYGGNGDDTIHGGPGVDFLYGDAGDDVFLANTTEVVGDRVNGGAHVLGDTLMNSAALPLVLANFNASALVEKIDGGGQPIFGTAGSDSLDFSAVTFVNVSFVDGRDGVDTITGTAAADVIFGGAGNDIVNGGAGDDTLYGYASDNASAAGIDGMHGNAGNDKLYAGVGGGNLFGDDGADKLYGNAGNDYMNGGNGNDLVDARTVDAAGADTLYGGAGDDTLFVGSGVDFVYGEDGADTIKVQGDVSADRINGGAGMDTLFLAGNTTLSAFNAGNLMEKIDNTAPTGPYTIAGTASTNVLDFSSLTNVAGTLTVEGGTTSNTLTASISADVFKVVPSSPSVTIDTIYNFKTSGADKIDLTAFGPLTLSSIKSQSGLFDTLLTLPTGKRVLIKNLLAFNLTTADFVGGNVN